LHLDLTYPAAPHDVELRMIAEVRDFATGPKNRFED